MTHKLSLDLLDEFQRMTPEAQDEALAFVRKLSGKPAPDLTPLLGSDHMRAALADICAALELPESEADAAMESVEALNAFAKKHGQSLDWIVLGDAQPMIRMLARLRPA